MQELKHCPICKSHKINKIFNERGDYYHNIEGMYQLNKCDKCKAVFLNPQPSDIELAKHYPSSYYSYNKSPKLKLNGQQSLLYKIYSVLLKSNISRSYPKLRPSERLLDIGCGNGTFLLQLRQLYPRSLLYGNDIVVSSKLAKQLAKDKIEINNDINLAKFPDKFFDYICLNHVIEHLQDPQTALSNMRRVLKDKGSIIIATPNTSSVQTLLFRNCWIALDVPRHIIIYNKNNISILIKKSRFKIIQTRYTGDPYSFISSLEYFLNKFRKQVYLADSRLVYSKVMFAIFIIPTVVLNILHISDSIEITIKKR